MPSDNRTAKRTAALTEKFGTKHVPSKSAPTKSEPPKNDTKRSSKKRKPTWEEANKRTMIYMPPGEKTRLSKLLDERGEERTVSKLVNDLLQQWEKDLA